MPEISDLEPRHPYRIQADGLYVTLTSENGDVQVKPDYKHEERFHEQIWTLEPAIGGTFGFRGTNSKFLGVNNYGHVGASVDIIREWERFSFERTENGYYFVVYWRDSKHYLFKPPNEEYLEATPHIGDATPMTIEDLL
ncbi:hypothetical protein BDV40DRAFT_298089 [Aspergillus tamarii]|uniref:Ricin B lectin domain-containing protein n=1 Tax=Aspergillus tamarii TaxID=41984 RepID=A0A5N6V1E8_ASPTM|nr:hypothetical protein BDV40DRAFT_298089 [Aspergillus tamarii]